MNNQSENIQANIVRSAPYSGYNPFTGILPARPVKTLNGTIATTIQSMILRPGSRIKHINGWESISTLILAEYEIPNRS